MMVVLAYNEKCISYPDRSTQYSPSTAYPEYLFEDVSHTENFVYEMVRKTFILARLDEEHLGTPEWNPLGNYIKKGNTVLLKPNWVENKNKYPEVDGELTCLVTNPSVVRAVLDYVLIALNGTGTVYLADAPMQGCDLQDMFKKAGYTELFEFYRSKGVDLRIVDLRKYSVKDKYNGVFSAPEMTKDSLGSKIVDLGSRSLHSQLDSKHPLYKVEDYPIELTKHYHDEGKHEYEVNAVPLTADVIINMPKPKTHRLAGITAACKNFVGITYEKACLPHRVDGDAERGNGDAYYKHSLFKQLMSKCNEKRTVFSRNGKYIRSKLFDVLMKGSYVIGSITSGDKYRIGSWYGNDTIWRTAVDLNIAMMYADKDGELREKKQRAILHIGDMIISGQKEGPVGPDPKPLGIILFSDNALAFDRTVCEIMGFQERCFPLFNHEKALLSFDFESKEQLEDTTIISNEKSINSKKVKDFPSINEWSFEPHPCWKGHIEKDMN